jgi:hypothetical protein
MRTPAIIAALALCCASVSAKEAAPEQTALDESALDQPLGGGKPVTTTIIRRCPEGYELVTRVDGRHGCAKDILPAND